MPRFGRVDGVDLPDQFSCEVVDADPYRTLLRRRDPAVALGDEHAAGNREFPAPMFSTADRWVICTRGFSCFWIRSCRLMSDFLHEGEELIFGERLLHVVHRAVLHALDGRLDGGVAGDDDDIDVGAEMFDGFGDIDAVHRGIFRSVKTKS